jgi:hypothetical protein
VPDEDPPAIRELSYALRTPGAGPLVNVGLKPVMPNASSCRLVLPSTTAPASRRRWTTGASVLGTNPRSAAVPAVEGRPPTWMLSFTTTGTPSSDRQAAPLPRRASTARAAASAPPSSSVTNAFSSGRAFARAR